jgi:tRNA A-37 threonylcarbamoyl transferase component Bud32
MKTVQQSRIRKVLDGPCPPVSNGNGWADRDELPDLPGQGSDKKAVWHPSPGESGLQRGPAAIDCVGAGSVAGGSFFPRPAIASGSRPHPAPTDESAARARLRALPLVYALIAAMATVWRCALLILVSVCGFGAHAISRLRLQVVEARQVGQYRLRRRIGAGGMGEVYLAEHRLLKRPCALKLIRPDRLGDPRAVARFEREVRATAGLSHPNTVEVYDYGRTRDGTYYFVMEYLPGLNLAELVERHGPVPPGRVVYLLRQICGALGEAHAAGLIHRDIKPSNVLAARRGGQDDVAKLLDFGLVRPAAAPSAAGLSADGQVVGTPLYMSPEQAGGGREVDERSDIYSLGAVAYHLLTGRPPFDGEETMAVLIAHARDPVIPPSQVLSGVPTDVERRPAVPGQGPGRTVRGRRESGAGPGPVRL